MRILMRADSRGGRGRGGLAWLGVAALLAVGLAGCGAAAPGAARTATPAPSRTVPPSIDWVVFVRFGGVMYFAAYTHAGRAIAEGDLGARFDTVRFKLDGNVQDPGYQAKDGDAAYLDAGTPVYAVKGYATTFRLAAHYYDALELYEADTNPAARTGADLLDLAGKVRAIAIFADDEKTQLAAITDAGRVADLVALVLRAPVDQAAAPPDGMRYALEFQLTDGTATVRMYRPSADWLQVGIRPPAEFRAAIEQALHT